MSIYTPSLSDVKTSATQTQENQSKYGLGQYGSSNADYAQLREQMYNEFLEMYLPIQQKMIDNLTNENYGKDLLNQAEVNQQIAQNTATQNSQFSSERMGLDDQGQSKSSKLQMALSNAKTKNSIRQNEEDRKLYLLTGTNSQTLSSISNGGQ